MIFYDDKKNRKRIARILVFVFLFLFVLTTYNVFSNISSARGNEIDINSDYYYKNMKDKKKVVLTFDDGPSEFTQEILDILEEYDVPAIFFLTGESVIHNKEFVKKIHDSGYDIGGHTYTHSHDSHSSEARLRWELNSTNKIIENVIGEPTIFYRPPYLLDIKSYPTFHDGYNVPSLNWIKESGYIVVGADIDSKDYEANNSSDVVDNILKDINAGGHIILFHDGGGDRSLTVDSLPYVIERLQRDGYEFVTVENILGIDGTVELSLDLFLGVVDEDVNDEVTYLQQFLRKEGYLEYKNINGVFDVQTENAVKEWKLKNDIIDSKSAIGAGIVDSKTREKILEVSQKYLGMKDLNNIKTLEDTGLFQKFLNSIYLTFISSTSSVMSMLFLIIISLGIIRIVFILLLYILSMLIKTPKGNWDDDVSVVIAAYNEEENIEATVLSVLRNTKKVKEIIVVDDGSKDKTADVVLALKDKYGDSIILKSVENGGKANAMNIGYKIATSPIVVTIDGDTALHPEAIKRLISHFGNESVWAVAGKVEVSKHWSLLGVFQTLEYITGQNIDKVAFNSINAVQVIPGAIGAWRRDKMMSLGGQSNDTLVEDQDLTLTILRNGGRIIYEGSAIAYTETPSTLNNFVKQRFRWIFGTIQCLYKHKGGIFDSKSTSMKLIVLPHAIIYGIFVPLMYPIIDILLVVQLLSGNVKGPLTSYLVFTAFDLLYSLIALSKEKGKLGLIITLPMQRIFYRQLISLVLIFSIIKAIEGSKAFWNKVDRTGTTKKFYDELVSEVYS